MLSTFVKFCFFFNDTATTEIYTLSLHDALPIYDPQLLIHTSWTPDVPGVTINLYQVGTAPDGTQSLTLVDTTKTSRSEEHTSELQSQSISYAVFCLKKK